MGIEEIFRAEYGRILATLIRLLGDIELAEDALRIEHWTVRGLDGKRVTLSSVRGQPVFLHLWETSCAPCLMELPAINKLATSMQDERLKFLLVTDEDEATVRKFVGSNRDLPVYLSGHGEDFIEERGVPNTYVLDRNGTVVFHHMGAANWDDDDVRAYLRDLAN